MVEGFGQHVITRLAVAWSLIMAAPALAQPSGVTGVTVAGTQALGTIGGVAWVRRWGTVQGVIVPGEKVVGLDATPKDAGGDHMWSAPFEVIVPASGVPGPGEAAAVLVEVENRGSPIMLDALDGLAATGAPDRAVYPAGLGNGFLEDHHLAYARIGWQTGIVASVPKDAEGVGEVILRDFGRALGDGRMGRYGTRLIGGISQSAWVVNTLIAEGFNVDPAGGGAVYQGAIAIDGTGNWLALNRLAAAQGVAEVPYFAPRMTVLPAAQLLHRPKSDPFYIDVANYTDFYRVHASLTDTTALPARMRRYDWPSPHHASTSAADAAATFAADRPGGACNGGQVVPLNPVSYAPFLRAITVELAHVVGAKVAAPALPPSTLFRLAPAPTKSAHFDPLPGARLQVPAVDAGRQPVGGVRFPEVVAPLGAPYPVSLPPVITSVITGVCGNIGEWQPMDATAALAAYGSKQDFLDRYAGAIDRLVAGRYLLASERPAMLADAARRWDALAR